MVPEVRWQFYPRVAAHPATRAFVESLVKRQQAAKTVDAYARNLEDLLRTWPDAPPERVTEADAADLDDYLARLHDRGPARPTSTTGPGSGTGLADATIQQRLVTVRLFYDFCIHRRRYCPWIRWINGAPPAAIWRRYCWTGTPTFR